MGQYENTLYTESTMVVRDVTAAQWKAQKLNAPKHSGITYRVDGVAEYRWNGTDWDAVVKASVNDLTGGSVISSGSAKPIPIGNAPDKMTRVIKQFSDLFGVTIAPTNATVVSTIDPTSPFGCPALKLVITFSTTAGRCEISPPALNIPAFNGHVAFSTWIDDATRVGEMSVFIGNTAYAKYRQNKSIMFNGGDLVAGHRVIYGGPICKNSVTDGGFVFGTDALQATKLRITAPNPLAGGPTTVWIKDCVIPVPQRPIVCFTWDDGYDSWVTKVLPILSKNGVTGTFAINTDQIDKGATGITSTNVASIISAGHQIASHNILNYKLQTLFGAGLGENNGTGTSQDATSYITDYHTARAALEAAGADPQGFCYHPYVQGGMDTVAAFALNSSGCDVARTTSPYEAQLYGFDLGNNAIALRAVNLDNTRTLAQATAEIDSAKAHGGLVVFMGHKTDDVTADGVTWLTADLDALVSYAAASGADILTARQVRDRFSQLGILKPRARSVNPHPVVQIGRLIGANMNVTTDQAITLLAGQWKIESVYVTKASASLTTAAGGVYTAPAKGGTAVVAAAQAYSGAVAATDVVAATVAANPTVSSGTIYLSLTTAQGAAATADVFVFGRPI